MNKIAVVILNYQNFEDTLACIESLQKNIDENVDIIVVDNASTNNSVSELNKKAEGISKLIISAENVGYAGGNNMGIRYAYEQNYNYICILNNDTIIVNNFISQMEKYLDEHNECAIIGPAILEYDQKDIVQSTGGFINFWKARTGLINSGKSYSMVDKYPQDVEWIGGACIMFRREVIKHVGYIPECYFLFFEETDWCCQARKKGFKVICQPEAYIYHKSSASVKQIKGLSFYLMERNRVIFLLRNASLLKKVVGISWLFLFEVLGIVLGRPNAKESIRCHWDGLTNQVSKKYPFVIIR